MQTRLPAAGHAACVADTSVLQQSAQPGNLSRRGRAISSRRTRLLNSGATSSTIGHGRFHCEASNYHSLQANVEKATTHGLSFQLSYTYAHALDNGSSFENAGFGASSTRGYNQFAPALNYGDSAFDVRQRLVFSPIYRHPDAAALGRMVQPDEPGALWLGGFRHRHRRNRFPV